MKKNIRILMIVGLSIAGQEALSQDEATAGRVSPKELAISASPIFDLMGATPTQVTRLSDIKDFKVDWSLKYGINPNLAIQAQPFWELFYNRKDLSRYQRASGFMRKLATIDISIGSVEDEDDYRRLGGAVKINLIRQKDPLMEKGMYDDISAKYKEEKLELSKQLSEEKFKLDTITNILEKPACRAQIRKLEDELNTINSRRMGEINERAKIFVTENWNASSLDMAFGRMHTFKSDSSGTFGKKKNDRSTGWGAWLNGNIGIGKRMQLSGLFRYFSYDEQVDFNVEDLQSSEESAAKAVSRNHLYSVGLNLRYGGPIYTFFLELLYEQKYLKTPNQIIQNEFKAPARSRVVESSISWLDAHPNTFTFGGDWRISKSVIINYGMRCVFDAGWKFKTFTPVATISCMMR